MRDEKAFLPATPRVERELVLGTPNKRGAAVEEQVDGGDDTEESETEEVVVVVEDDDGGGALEGEGVEAPQVAQ